MPDITDRIESIFALAVALPPQQRAAYLDQECANTPEIRPQIEALLQAHEKANHLLDRPAEGANATALHLSNLHHPGDLIAGRYKLLEQIGEGGMGEVWVADQLEPLRRRVALKLIKPGMDSRAVLARFEAERQALALMDHPNIAKVLDAGTTADHRPYFVMELVKGTPVTTFCDARKLSPRERLELFIPVCQAIQHAHTKGIIHRDIKPSNVLVALHDEKPIPKVIDFGVSKAIGQQLTENTIYTGLGTLVGTPTYMAPEQATFNQLDIDTRADVYALGVLLYELLAGSPPVESERMQKAALDELLRVVREEEPPRPSQRLSTSQSKASIAAVRQSDPEKLSKLIRGELDWIVMKALEKDRNRRYETANGFAADVQRYLAGEQVQAVPPSAIYRLQKFARKNRALLTTAGAFAALLVAFAGISGWLAMKAKQAESVSSKKRAEAEANAKEAAEMTVLHQKAAMDHFHARLDAEVLARGLQVDLDLETLRNDSRLGLLRLAKPYEQNLKGVKLKAQAIGNDPEFQAILDTASEVTWDDGNGTLKALREFTTAAVLANGQEFTPLLPPITHEGQEVTSFAVSPDYRRLATLGADLTVRLWDIKTAKQLAILRRADERIVNFGISSDGGTIFTEDATGVARFWDVDTGSYRAEIARIENIYSETNDPNPPTFGGINKSRIDRKSCVRIGQDRLLTQRVITKPIVIDGKSEGEDQLYAGPVELWDTKTGIRIARLDQSEGEIQEFQFQATGKWITTRDGDRGLIVFSPEDGRELTRLILPEEEGFDDGPYISPDANHFGFRSFMKKTGDVRRTLRVWDTRSWKPEATQLIDGFTNPQTDNFRIWNDGLYSFLSNENFLTSFRQRLHRIGRQELIAESLGWTLPSPKNPHQIMNADGQIFDSRDWTQLKPPKGQKYHPDLANFSKDGRFVSTRISVPAFFWSKGFKVNYLIDLMTQKRFPVPDTLEEFAPLGHLEQSGLATAVKKQSVEIRLIPSALEPVDPEHLQLWAQVAVRGKLDDSGELVKWTEAQWEKKREELAAVPSSIKEFPFPGYVAQDKLHWLRAEFNEADEANKPALAAMLEKRADEIGAHSEAARWRSWISNQRKSTPPSDQAQSAQPK